MTTITISDLRSTFVKNLDSHNLILPVRQDGAPLLFEYATTFEGAFIAVNLFSASNAAPANFSATLLAENQANEMDQASVFKSRE